MPRGVYTVKHLFFMSCVPSLTEVIHFKFLDAGIPKAEVLGTNGYLGNVGLVVGFLVMNLDEWSLEGK